MRRRAWMAAAVLAGCVPAAGPAPGPSDVDALVPPGYGTLRQDEITLTLTSGDLQVKVTPLAEWVLRLAAPDTHRRLSALAATHRASLAEAAGGAPALFLVSFFSRAPGTVYRPEDLELVNRGRRVRPTAIRGISPRFDARRLDAEATEMAVYAFPAEVDLDQDLVAEYGSERSLEWSAILRRLEAERARVRGRVGGAGEVASGYASSP